jgi:transposase-like protein
MQRIYPCELTVEQYIAIEWQRQVVAEAVCPRCRSAEGLIRHGSYGRWVTTEMGVAVLILVARFLCSGCKRTVSYLPSFALSYRVVAAAMFEAFLDGDRRGLGANRWADLLRSYERRMQAFHPQLLRVMGRAWGRAPPGGPAFWPWLKEACGSLTTATRRLVEHFKITVFRSYQCHQPSKAL